MSYILEALKRSQQERELGQIPRLERGLFDTEPLPEPRRMPAWVWVPGLILLGASIVGATLYALRTSSSAPRTQPTSNRAVPATSQPIISSTATDTRVNQPMAPEVRAPSAATSTPVVQTSNTDVPAVRMDSSTPTPEPSPTNPTRTSAVASLNTPAASSTPVGGDDGLGIASEAPSTREPEVLVVPAPPSPGEQLPRGAEELRRAVLGPAASPPAIDSEPRQPPPADEPVPIPDDLLADIELFKRSVKGGGGGPPDAESKASKSAPIPPRQTSASKAEPTPVASTRVSPASQALRAKLPPLSLSVHVYDAKPRRRFVYINGRKLSEGDTGRDGIKVEEILSDGAVLSWRGERFFEPR